MKNFIRRKLQSFLDINSDIQILSTRMDEIEAVVEENEEKITDLEDSVETNEGDIDDIQRDFRNFPDAEDIPEQDDIMRDVESMIESEIEDAFSNFQRDNFDRIDDLIGSGDHEEILKIVAIAEHLGAITKTAAAEIIENSAIAK